MRWLLAILGTCSVWAGTLEDLAKQVRQTGLDATECYRVRDIRFARDEIKIYFTDGYLVFGKPVGGNRITAVFSADVEGGDAELLLMPPVIRERRSLAAYTKTPNLNEHFRQAVLVFTDRTADELLEAVRTSGAKRVEEIGTLLADRWNPVLGSFHRSFEVRLVEDLLSPRRVERGFFFAAVSGNTLGNFDVIFDPRSTHQISVGQVAFRDERRYFDIWTNFEAQSWRMGRRQPPARELQIEDVKIDATIQPDLMLQASTHLRVIPAREERTLAFELAQPMKITEALVDGEPVEAFSPESLRANLLRGTENNLVLLTREKGFAAGVPIDIHVKNEGRVILTAGEKVYFVGARGLWYPNRSVQFAHYDATFRYPKNLDLVATGDLVSETIEGDWKISRRKTGSPVRLFGFNLGDYEREKSNRGGLSVEVCANRRLETALQPRARAVEVPSIATPPFPRGARRQQTEVVMMPGPLPDPTARLKDLAAEIASVFEEMSTKFGPPPLKSLIVSPIPGRFGQGFPGLVYLSTLAYLEPNERPAMRNNSSYQTFFSEILHAHEVAHQWWGNGITGADYQDDWLMEALATYSSLWVLEKRKGTRALDSVLEGYKEDLLRKTEDGRTIDSIGPVTMGHRLVSSQAPNAWSIITYNKGAWIIHMLRKRLGDDAFQKMLAQLYRDHRYGQVTTDRFREIASGFQPKGSPDPKLESFFEQWVYGTGIPSLKLTWSVSGRAPKVVLKGSITQSEVDDDFSAWVPVEIVAGRGKPIVKWVQSGDGGFQVTLPSAPTRVTLDSGNSTLARK